MSISSVEDMKLLFDGIPLGEVSTSMTINAPAMVLLAMYIVAAEEQGANMNGLRGTIQNDILKEYIARGTYVFPPKESMRLITDIFEFCSTNVPLWNTISICHHIREAGSTAVQEVAFTLANALASWTQPFPKAWRLTLLPLACRSFSTATTISLRRSPNFGLHGPCGTI